MTEADRLVELAVAAAPGPIPIELLLANSRIDGLLSSRLTSLLGDERVDAAEALLSGFATWCEARAVRVVTKSSRARFTEAEEATVLSRLFFLSAADGVTGVESRRSLATQFDGWREKADPDRITDSKNHRKLWQSYLRLLGVFLVESDANRADPDQTISAKSLSGRSLPRSHAHFVGRLKELSQMAPAFDGNIVLVSGPPAIGKTTFLTYWASANSMEFPDGQVYLDMRGYGEEVAIAGNDGLQAILRAVGAMRPNEALDVPELEQLGRETFATKSLLVVLDNVAHVSQVEPFVVSGSRTAIVVGSRSTLEELVLRFGAVSVNIDPFTPDEASEFFQSYLGERAPADRDDLDAIALTCGYWPLALALVASKLAIHSNLSTSSARKALKDQGAVLDQTLGKEGATPLRAAFEWSFAALPPDLAIVFAGLSTVPTPTISSAAAEWIAEMRVLGPGHDDDGVGQRAPRDWRLLKSTVAIELGRLAAESLLEVYENGSYGFHLLIRQFAQQKLEEIERASSPDVGKSTTMPSYEAIVAFGYYSTRSLNVMIYETRIDLGNGPMEASEYVGRAWLDDEADSALEALNWAYFEAEVPVDLDLAALAWVLADHYLSQGNLKAATNVTFICALALQDAVQSGPAVAFMGGVDSAEVDSDGEGGSLDVLQSVYDMTTWRLGLVSLQLGPESFAAEFLAKLGDHDGQMVRDILRGVDRPGIRSDPLSTVKRMDDLASSLTGLNRSDAWSSTLEIAQLQAASAAAEQRTDLAKRIFTAMRGAVTRHSLSEDAELIEAIVLGYIGAAKLEDPHLAARWWDEAEQLSALWSKVGLLHEIKRARRSSAPIFWR
jgi:hypothetical protein